MIPRFTFLIPTLCAAAALPAQGNEFTAATQISSVDDPNADERSPAPSRDELYMVFASNRRGDYDLYETRRADVAAPWQTPQRLVGLSTSDDEIQCSLSFDGRELHFVRKQSGTDVIYVATRPASNAPWGPPTALPAPINAANISNGFPRLTQDGLRLFFTREGAGGLRQILTALRPARSLPFGAPVLFAPAAALPGSKSSPIPEANGRIVSFAVQSAAANPPRWYRTHQNGAGAFVAPYRLTSLDVPASDDANHAGQTGRFYQTSLDPVGKLGIFIRCYRLDTQTITYCVDVDLVPVWDPILGIYVFQNVWQWAVGTVTTLTSYTWRSLSPTAIAVTFLSVSSLPPLHIPGFNGPLLINPANVVMVAPAALTADGLGQTTVSLPANPALAGARLFAQTLRYDPATGDRSLSTVSELRIVP